MWLCDGEALVQQTGFKRSGWINRTQCKIPCNFLPHYNPLFIDAICIYGNAKYFKTLVHALGPESALGLSGAINVLMASGALSGNSFSASQTPYPSTVLKSSVVVPTVFQQVALRLRGPENGDRVVVITRTRM